MCNYLVAKNNFRSKNSRLKRSRALLKLKAEHFADQQLRGHWSILFSDESPFKIVQLFYKQKDQIVAANIQAVNSSRRLRTSGSKQWGYLANSRRSFNFKSVKRIFLNKPEFLYLKTEQEQDNFHHAPILTSISIFLLIRNEIIRNYIESIKLN